MITHPVCPGCNSTSVRVITKQDWLDFENHYICRNCDKGWTEAQIESHLIRKEAVLNGTPVHVGRPAAGVCHVCGEDVFYQGSSWWDAQGWQGGDSPDLQSWHDHSVLWVRPPRDLERVVDVRSYLCPVDAR